MRHPAEVVKLPHYQCGAIGILSATVLLMLIVFIALTVDTGRLYFEKRRLQQQADLAAMAAAQRFCDGFVSVAQVTPEVNASLTDNGFALNDAANAVTVSLGEVNVVSSRRVFVESSAMEAARVRLSRNIPASLFAGGMFGGNVGLFAEAVAERNVIGGLQVGSILVSFDTEKAVLLNQLLSAMLGTGVVLDAVGYNGLAASDISLLALRDGLAGIGIVAAAGTVNEVANASLSMGQLLSVVAQALANDGTVGAAAVDAADDLHLAAQGTAAYQETVALGEILVADSDYASPDDALNARVNALQLIRAAAMLINRDNLLNLNLNVATNSLPLLNSLLGNTLSSSVKLKVIEPPQVAVGRFGYDEFGQPRTRARTAQVQAQASVHLDLGSGVLGSILSALAGIEGDIAVATEVAQGDAWLDRVDQCPRLRSRDFDFSIAAQPGLASLKVGDPDDLDQPANLTIEVLPLLGLIPIGGTAEVQGNQSLNSASSETLSFSVDLAQADSLPSDPRRVGTDLSDAVDSLNDDLDIDVTINLLLIPVSLGDLLSGLVDTLNPVLTGLAELVLEPLLNVLGIEVGQAEVRLISVDEGQGALLI